MYSFIISLCFAIHFINPSVCLNSTNNLKTLISLEDIKLTANLNSSKIINTLVSTLSPMDDVNVTSSKNSSKLQSSADLIKLPTTPSKSFKNQKKTELSGEDYEDSEDYEVVYDNENGGGGGGRNVTRQRHIYVMKRQGITYAWGRWGKWSRCLNSCVQIRKRQCIERIQNSTNSDNAVEILFYPDLSKNTTGCVGVMKKYRLCKDEKCLKYTNSQMRNEQCSLYNREPYKGKFYNWLGYEKEHNECELYCKPMDSDIFISMNQSVTDGTPCGKPSIYYTHYYRRKAVCVKGICKLVELTF